MVKTFSRGLTAVALMLFAGVASAEPGTYQIDPAHSEAGFKIRHFFSKVPGRFDDLAGTIVHDEKDLSKSSVNVVIQSASINTANERRDNHLRGDDFFAAEENPTITFASTKVVPGDGNRFKIVGDLTMRGVTRPVTLDAELVGAGPVAIGGKSMGVRAGFKATTTINRKDFGINWNKLLDNGGTMLDDMVAIELHVEAMKPEAAPDEQKSSVVGKREPPTETATNSE